MLPCASAVFCSSGSSSTSTSVITTWAAAVASVSASWRHEPRGVDLDCHVGELETNGLVLPEPLSELLSVLPILEGELVGRTGDAECAGYHAGPSCLERHPRAEGAGARSVCLRLASQPVIE